MLCAPRLIGAFAQNRLPVRSCMEDRDMIEANNLGNLLREPNPTSSGATHARGAHDVREGTSPARTRLVTGSHTYEHLLNRR